MDPLNDSLTELVVEVQEIEAERQRLAEESDMGQSFQIAQTASRGGPTKPGDSYQPHRSLTLPGQGETSSAYQAAGAVEGRQLSAANQMQYNFLAGPPVQQLVQKPAQPPTIYYHEGVTQHLHPYQPSCHNAACIAGGYQQPSSHIPPPPPVWYHPSITHHQTEARLNRLIQHQAPVSDSNMNGFTLARQLRSFYYSQLSQLYQQTSIAYLHSLHSNPPQQLFHLSQYFTYLHSNKRASIEHYVICQLEQLEARLPGNANFAVCERRAQTTANHSAILSSITTTANSTNANLTAVNPTIANSTIGRAAHPIIMSVPDTDAQSVLPRPAPQSQTSERRSQRPPVNKLPLKKWINDNIENPYPDGETVEQLSRASGMCVSRVKKWFFNHRHRTKNTRNFNKIMQLRREARRKAQLQQELK